jgi:outer membrane protease
MSIRLSSHTSFSAGWTAALLACVFALCPALALAQDTQKAFSLTTSTSMGLLYGQASEYVYNQYLSKDYKNSELDWPFEPLFYAGARLDLDTKLGIFASLDVKQGFAGKTGTMTDSDFLNGDGTRTHFSESDSYTERALLLDLKVGYDFPSVMEPLTIGVYGGFSYMDFKWSARNGYYQYPTTGYEYGWDGNGNFYNGTYTPWSADETKTPIYGVGILYEQAYLIGLVGLRASYKVGEAFTLGASCSIGPIASCYTADNHELRQVDFYSTLSNGFLIEPGLSLEYAVKPGASLRLDVDYRQVSGLKGDLTEVAQGTTSTSSYYNYYAGPDSASTGTGDSGAFISMLDASLSFRLSF